MKTKVHHLFNMTSFIFVGFIVNSGISFRATPSLPVRNYKYAKPSNGCLVRNRQQRESPSCLFGLPVPVEQVDLQTGEVINTFQSQTKAARTLGIKQSRIAEVLGGKIYSCGGYFWRRAGDKAMPSQHKMVEQVDRRTGEVINTFLSASEAVRTLNTTAINSSGISCVIHGQTKSCGGYFWRRPGDKTMPPQHKTAPTPVEQVDCHSGGAKV